MEWAGRLRAWPQYRDLLQCNARYIGNLLYYQGLRETGFVEGRDTSIEFRWADGHSDLLPSLAAELVTRSEAVI